MIGALDYLGVNQQERRPVIFLLMGFFVVGNVVWLFMEPELIDLRERRADNSAKNKSLPVQHEYRARQFTDGWRLTQKEYLILNALYNALARSGPQTKATLEEYQDQIGALTIDKRAELNNLQDRLGALTPEQRAELKDIYQNLLGALTPEQRAELEDFHQNHLNEAKRAEESWPESLKDRPELEALFQDSRHEANSLSFDQFLDEIEEVSWNDANTLSFNQFAMKTHLKREKTELKTLRGLEDAKVVTGQVAAQKLMNLVETKARRSGLSLGRTRGSQGSARSNKEFDEFKRTIKFQSGMIELVRFLKEISNEKLMIRVSDMKILPTPDRRKLQVELTFVASYLKPETDSESSKASKKKDKMK